MIMQSSTAKEMWIYSVNIISYLFFAELGLVSVLDLMLLQAFQPIVAQLSFESCAAIWWKTSQLYNSLVRQGFY